LTIYLRAFLVRVGALAAARCQMRTALSYFSAVSGDEFLEAKEEAEAEP
jgi:hypothetical protein